MNRKKRFKSVLILQSLQLAHETKTWIGPILFACLAAYYIFRGELSLGGFLSSPGSLLVLTLCPLIICAGLVSDDVRTGRVLWLHAFGVGRTEYIIAKIIAATLLATLPISVSLLAFFAYLGSVGHRSSWTLFLLVHMSIVFYFLYWSSFLILLSTILRSWANSAVAYGLQLTFPFVVVPTMSRMPSIASQLNPCLRTLCYGPISSVLRLARDQEYPRAELVVTSLAIGLFIAGAAYIYRHTAFGEALRKDG